MNGTGRVMWAAGVVAAGLIAGGCDGPSGGPGEGGDVRIVASIGPLADAARQIGGEDVTVTALLLPGQTPHGFEPRPRQVEQMAEADLLLTVGLGMDPWADRAAASAGRTDLAVFRFADVVRAEAIKVTPHGHDDGDDHEGAESDAHDHEHEHAHAHDAGDPHLWLDPVLMKAYAAVLSEKLAALDPDHADGYRTRGAAFAADLDALNADYARVLGSARLKAFVSFHSAFTYTAARYGLTQEAVFEADRAGVGPRHLEHVIEFMKEHGVKVVFAEPQFPIDRLRPILDQVPGATVRQLDPLGDPNVPGRDTYLNLMRHNLAVFADALGCTDAP